MTEVFICIFANTFITTGPIPIKLCMLTDSQTPFSSNKNETTRHPALIVQCAAHPLIYINDIEDDISSKVLKFADDTKVFRKNTNDTDKQSLQDDLDKLVKWSEKWQMLFNFGKYKCIHIGHGNMDEEYKMGDAVLGKTTQEKT